MSGATARRALSRHYAALLARAFRPGRLAAAFLLAAFSFALAPGASARGTDGIFYQPYVTNRVVLEGTGEVNNIYTSNRGTDIDPDTPGIQVRGIMDAAVGCFAPRRPGTLAVTARIISGDRGAVGIEVRNNGALQCVYAWAKTDEDRSNDSVRVTATAVLTSNGTEVDRFEDTFTVEQRDTMSGVGESVGEGAPLDLTAPSNRTYTVGTAISAFTLSPATGGTAPLRYELSGLPGGLVFSPGTRRLSGTPLAATATPATVTYRVTDANGATASDTFTVTVAAVGTTLSALSLRAGGAAVPLSPAFGQFTTRYAASVAHDVATVTVGATGSEPSATVSISPADADGSTPGHQVALSQGENRITATVTSEVGLSRNYIVTVTRPVSPFWSATLRAGAGSGYIGYCTTSCSESNFANNVGGSVTAGTSTFAEPGTGTTVNVRALTWQGDDFGSTRNLFLRLDPLPSASVRGGWLLDVGGFQADVSCGRATSNNILRFKDFFTSSNRPASGATVSVTLTEAEGGPCPTPDATLSALAVTVPLGDSTDDLTLDPPFAAGTTSYTTSVAANVATVGVSPYVSDSAFATVSIAPADADPSTGGHQVNLSAGENTITVTVTNGSATQDYTVTVTRGAGGTEAPTDGLQARFGVQPAWHTGMPFWTELHFSAEPGLGYKDLRDKAFEVTGARITRAQRIEKSSNRSWRLLVEPAGFGDISLTLPVTEDCTAEGAVCTAEGARLETGLGLVVPGPGERLAARLKGASSHTGEAFRPELHFNHEPNLSYRNVRDSLFAVTGGHIARAQRLVKGSNLGWRLTVEPDGVGAVELELPATEDCSAEGAVCTRDGQRLERGIAWTVEGPVAFSVSDAEADEAPGAALAFEVSLSRRLRAEARVDVATRDGTATAGADYEAVTRSLVFAPGETVKTVEVAVLDDAHDEGEETMTLVLSNAKGALIDDAEGTGTIVNTDAIPKAWIARFGRTVTGQVLDAVEARLAAPRQAGGRMSVAGYTLVEPGGSGGSAAQTPALATVENRAAMSALGDWMDGAGRSQEWRERRIGGPEPQSLDIARHALVTGTAFTLTGGSAEGGGFASLWGHASVAGFDGREDALTLDGEVTTGFLGADWAADPGSESGAGRWTAGLALGHSVGTGGYRNGACEENSAQSGGCGGRIEADLTGLYPYAGLDVTERVSVWLAGGHGAGELTVVPDGSGAIETDLSMSMGAGGTRIAVLAPEGGEGLRLALKGDGRFTRTSSDASHAPGSGNLAEAEADVWLLRFGFEGSRPFTLGGSGTGGDAGASLTPSFELALRRDGGDAETGLGADTGGGLALAAPERGLRFDLKGRALVAHEAQGFREWGASAGFGFNPRPATERGLSLSLRQSWGASPSGGMDALLDRETLTGLTRHDTGTGFEASSRLTGTLGYGLPAFGGGFTGTPNIGFGLSETGRDWRLGWRLTPARPGASGFEVTLDATWRESANADAEHGVALGGRLRW